MKLSAATDWDTYTHKMAGATPTNRLPRRCCPYEFGDTFARNVTYRQWSLVLTITTVRYGLWTAVVVGRAHGVIRWKASHIVCLRTC